MIILKLIQNEIIKILQRRKSLITVIAFVLLVGAFGFATYKDVKHAREWSTPAKQIEQEKQNLEYLKGSKDEENTEAQIKASEAKIKELENIQNGEIKFDWREETSNENKVLKESLNQSKNNEEIKLQIEQNEYLIKHNITPQKYNYNMGGTKFLMILFEILGAMFLVVGIILFGADIVSGEFTPPTAKFLMIQPVSRGKILFSKFAALFITSVLLIIPIELIAFLIMGLLLGFGDMNYPVIVGGKYVFDAAKTVMGEKTMVMAAGSAHIITMGEYIIRLLLMQILFILTAAAFTIFMSTVIRNSMVSMSVGIISVIAVQILQQIPYTKKITEYIFTTYGNFSRVFDGSIATGFNNPGLTFNFVMIIFIAWIIISYAVSHILFVKRDMIM